MIVMSEKMSMHYKKLMLKSIYDNFFLHYTAVLFK